MIVVTVFHSIFNQMQFNFVQNWKEIYHHNHIPFNFKGTIILFFKYNSDTNMCPKEIDWYVFWLWIKRLKNALCRYFNVARERLYILSMNLHSLHTLF